MSRSTRLRRFFFFFVGTLLQKGGQFLLLPLLVGSMDSGEFARFGLFTAVTFILVPLFSLNVHISAGRLFFDHADRRDQASLFVTLLTSGMAFVAGGVVLLCCLLQLVGLADPLTLGDPLLMSLVGASVISAVPVQFFGLLFRLVDRPSRFALVSALLGFGLLAVYAALEGFFTDKLMASVVAYLVNNLLTTIIGAAFARRYLARGRFRRSAVSHAISFGSGTMVQNVVSWVNAQSGRWIGTLVMPVSALAGYTLMTYAAMAANLAANVLFETVRIDIMNAHVKGDPGRSRQIVDRTLGISILAVVLLYAIVLGLQTWQDQLLPPGYHVGVDLVYAALAFSVFQIVFMRAFWLATTHKRTKSLASAMVVMAVITVGLSWLFGRWYGDLGLMVGSAIGAFLQAATGNLLMWWLVVRKRPATPSGG